MRQQFLRPMEGTYGTQSSKCANVDDRGLEVKESIDVLKGDRADLELLFFFVSDMKAAAPDMAIQLG